jgi:hypothetical protein
MLSRASSRSFSSIIGIRKISRRSCLKSLGNPSWRRSPSSFPRFPAPEGQVQIRRLSSPVFDYEDTATNTTTTSEKSIEEQYSKKTPLEHVLLRPGMYVGPVERLPPNHCWVLEPTPKPYNASSVQPKNRRAEPYRMAYKEYGFIPALTKIFDEILVNASDNRLRNPKTCTKLDVRIDPGAKDRDPSIRIWNNGKGIPIQVRPPITTVY